MALKFVLASLIVTAIIVVMTTQPASAADYSAAYALEANGKTETGKIENCNSIDACRIKLRTMEATVHLSYFPKPAGGGDVVLSMWGDSAYCYFRDGNDTISLDMTTRLHVVTIYAGHARRGNEVVRNQELGVLYLSFAGSH